MILTIKGLSRLFDLDENGLKLQEHFKLNH